MTAISRTAEPAEFAAAPRLPAILRRLRLRLLRAIDGLAPQRPQAEYRDLPEKWYEYPPY